MSCPPTRKAFNAKARNSTSGSRKKGKSKKRKYDTHQPDPNIDILEPTTTKKEQLLQEICSQSESKWTSKRKRKLEQYIEKKIKKEDRLLLFEKLIQSQASVATSALRPSSTLGSNKKLTKHAPWTGIMTQEEENRESGSDEEIVETDARDTDDQDDQNTHDVEVKNLALEPMLNATKRSSGFKNWAVKQLEKVKSDFVASDSSTEADSLPPTPKRRKTSPQLGHALRGPLGESLEIPVTLYAQQVKASGKNGVKVVEVKRLPVVEDSRILLPILAEEQIILETILLNPVVIICGETGSGKTTQIPQFLYEAGFGTPKSENPGMIGITQPRRVAAVSMAQRVAYELSLDSARVSYQIRYDATVSPNTSIKFMTDGVLLRELASDFLLTKYSVIIIDEAHERNINTDILIGVLSRVIKLREQMWNEGKDDAKPLRLVIMSATLRVTDFSENKRLFPSPPPVIDVAARQHPVTIHFSRRTYSDYITQAINKTIQIHRKLPPGGILVFLTGQNDIVGVCKKLESKFGRSAIKPKQGYSRSFSAEGKILSRQPIVSQAPVEVEDFELHEGVMDNDELFEEECEEIQEDNDLDSDLYVTDPEMLMHIVPLYSMLPSEKQMRVFESPPPNCRLVVVSTNIAETSLTIPGIRYVVDCGRVKERRYDATSGMQSFHVTWISKASSAQRAGRAGRTEPGHCYRLYSSAFYEHHFDSFSTPEIQRMPIDGVVLQMKSMGIDTIINFPFPSPPQPQALSKAQKILEYLGALTPAASSTGGGQITELGRAMALFPLSPRFSKMLLTGQQRGCLPYIICIVSALAVGNPFIRLEDEVFDVDNLSKENEGQRQFRKAFYDSQRTHAALGNYTSDLFSYLSIVGAYEYASGDQQFCAENFVQPKVMQEIHNLRLQIANIVCATFPGVDLDLRVRLTPPTDRQLNTLRQILTASLLDQVAVRKDVVEKHSSGTRFLTAKGIPYRALGVSEDVFLHPSSILIDSPPPAYLVYNEIVRSSRTYIRYLTVVNPTWLSTLGKDSLCFFSKAVKNNLGVLVTIPIFGPDRWELPAVVVDTALQR